VRRGLQLVPHSGTSKERQMSQTEVRRKLRAFPSGGLFFLMLTRF
jgi:hypothetical protein